jgi:type II secretory pathway pseudopilin PulG
MKRASTLLETLAAITLLGMVISAVIPIILRLGSGERDLQERLAARQWLLTTDILQDLTTDSTQPVKGRPGWYVQRRTFLRISAKTPEERFPLPPHGWIQLLVCRGAERDAEVLAERLLLLETTP